MLKVPKPVEEMSLLIISKRREYNMTQEEFSRYLGISRSYLANLENKKRIPSMVVYEDIMNKLSDKLIQKYNAIQK